MIQVYSFGCQLSLDLDLDLDLFVVEMFVFYSSLPRISCCSDWWKVHVLTCLPWPTMIEIHHPIVTKKYYRISWLSTVQLCLQKLHPVLTKYLQYILLLLSFEIKIPCRYQCLEKYLQHNLFLLSSKSHKGYSQLVLYMYWQDKITPYVQRNYMLNVEKCMKCYHSRCNKK